jgi:hypothetical protein
MTLTHCDKCPLPPRVAEGGGSGRGGYGVADVVLEPPRKRPARVLMINNTTGVLVGDHRYEGWLVRQHPDGPWVTMRKLEAVEPEGLVP